MDRNELIFALISRLLDDNNPVVNSTAPKAAPKATTRVAPKTTLRSMAAHAEATEEVATKLHEAFPMAEGTLEFDTVGNVRIATGLKSSLVAREGNILVREHQYGNYQMQVWTYGPCNVTFAWPTFLKLFGDPTRYHSVAIDASRGRLQEIPENTKEVKFLSEYIESEGGENKFRLKWRRITL